MQGAGRRAGGDSDATTRRSGPSVRPLSSLALTFLPCPRVPDPGPALKVGIPGACGPRPRFGRGEAGVDASGCFHPCVQLPVCVAPRPVVISRPLPRLTACRPEGPADLPSRVNRRLHAFCPLLSWPRRDSAIPELGGFHPELP